MYQDKENKRSHGTEVAGDTKCFFAIFETNLCGFSSTAHRCNGRFTISIILSDF